MPFTPRQPYTAPVAPIGTVPREAPSVAKSEPQPQGAHDPFTGTYDLNTFEYPFEAVLKRMVPQLFGNTKVVEDEWTGQLMIRS